MSDERFFPQIMSFLKHIEISVLFKELPNDTFLPGMQIEHGSLAVDRAKLIHVGDILHEAGHIACMAPSKRAELFADAGDEMGEEIASHAWSYAAALACNVPPELVFHENGYKGSADWLCKLYQKGGTNGVPLLQWYDMTKMPVGDNDTEEQFPSMKRWLRPMDDPMQFWKDRGY